MSLPWLISDADFKYFAVPIPKDATQIEIVISLRKHFTIDLLNSSLIFKMKGGIQGFEHLDGLPISKIELLGVISNGEEISEEKLLEFLPYCQYDKDNTPALHSEKGILIENPMKKPDIEDSNYSPANFSHEFVRQMFEEDMQAWKSYESKLVKAVIIKVKK